MLDNWTTDLVFTELNVVESLNAIWGLYWYNSNCPSLSKLFFSSEGYGPWPSSKKLEKGAEVELIRFDPTQVGWTKR